MGPGASVPLRSPWFGEGLTSATTEDSGRNSDATIRAPPGMFAGAVSTCARRKARRQERRLCRNNATRQARTRARALTLANPVCCRRDAPQKSDGRAGMSPTRPSNSGTPSSRLCYSHNARRSRQYATRSSAPTIRHLVNVPRTSLLAFRRRSGRPRRHSGGRRPARAARRACRGLVVLEVRRVLELLLGPADFELDHGGVVVAAGHGGVATSGRAAAGVGGGRAGRRPVVGAGFFSALYVS